jgi:superfamily II DNA or RNA helicase
MNNWQWRPYQVNCFESIISAYRRGVSQQLIVQATGLGKRSQAVFMASKARNSLFLAHTEELIDQAYHDFVKWYGIENVGMIRGSRMETDKRFVVSSPLTIVNRLDKISPDHFDMVQLDEVHHFLAKSYYRSATYWNCKMRLGWTATPKRLDGLSLMDLFQESTFEYGILKGIQDGYLAELKGIRIKTDVNLSSARKTMGDFNQQDLHNLVDVPARNNLIVDSYLKYAEGRQFIAFAVDTIHSCNIAQTFRERGMDIGIISSDKNVCPDREGLISKFKSGQLLGLTNCNVLTEGFDYPNVGVILDASPTMSEARFLQRVGRGTRIKSPDFQKRFGNNCLVLDFVDLSSKHKLVNTFELDRTRPAEEKVFVTTEEREKLLNAEKKRRESKVMSEVEKDEYFDLASPPKIKVSKSDKMMEEATPAQIKLLRWLQLYDQYDETGQEIEYTKKTVAELLQSEILPWMKRKMIEWKYNPTGATMAQYLAISAQKKAESEKMSVEEAQQRMRDQMYESLQKQGVQEELPF